VTTLFDLHTPVPAAPAAGAGPRPLIIGADLSLRSTGLGSADWTDYIRPKTKTIGHPRLAFLMEGIGDFLKNADLVVLEGPSYGHAGQGGHEELAGLRVMVQHWLWRRGIPYAVVPPSTLKLFFAGHGQASKAGMREAAERLYGRTFEGPAANDECDAFALAAAGYHHLGMPLVEIPERQSAALTSVQWPHLQAVAS
jgi:Holliday junction resolvasome RuvABC endonuclease subunit